MTESEAKAKWCPFARVLGTLTKPAPNGFEEMTVATGAQNRGYAMGGALLNCMCIGSACMAWREEFIVQVEHANNKPHGDGWIEQPRGGTWNRRERTGRFYCGLAGKP